MSLGRSLGVLAFVLWQTWTGLAACAQPCGQRWLPGDGVPGVNNTVWATTMWDPDGLGPQSPKLVVGGSFTFAGNVPADSIAVYDFATGAWSPLGSGTNGGVSALAVLPSGDLVAAGNFTSAGGVTANGIARWNGSAWSSLGSGMGGTTYPEVFALTVLPSGDLVAGGGFTTAGGVPANYVARWNGSSWQPLGAEPTDRVFDLAVSDNGDLIAGGEFTGGVARWNGSTWSVIGTGIGGIVQTVAVLPDGNVIAGGRFGYAGGVSANQIARWDGSTWSPLGSGIGGARPYFVDALAVLPNGDLIAGGTFTTAGGIAASSIARWNGSSWSSLESGVGGLTHPSVRAMAVLPGGDLIAGGNFTAAGGVGVNSIARWSGSAWSPLGSGINGNVLALAERPNGDVIVGGNFMTAGGVAANAIASWNGSSWLPLGSGITGPDAPSVYSLAVLPNGDVIAGGNFTTAGGIEANDIARWNGSAWSPLGTGMSAAGINAYVYALAVMPNGDVIAGGSFTAAGAVSASRVARWNGSAWSSLGSGMGGSDFPEVYCLAVLPNGDLIAGGRFIDAGNVHANHIARWNGSIWSLVGSGMQSSVHALAVAPGGELIAGGRFMAAGGVPANGVARWNGSTWAPLGSGVSGFVYTLAMLPNGNVLAGGNFSISDGESTAYVARWNGFGWPPLGSGTNAAVSTLAVLANGELAVGGSFMTADGTASSYFARYSFSIIPTISVQPTPQSISAGQTLTLSATPSNGYTNVGARWRRNGVPVDDGPGGASPGGGTVSGASITLPSPTNGTPAVLTISSALPSDAGDYTVVFQNACGGVIAATVTVAVHDPCPADFNSNGFVDSQDFYEFLVAFFGMLPIADFNHDGVINSQDFTDFLSALFAGC